MQLHFVNTQTNWPQTKTKIKGSQKKLGKLFNAKTQTDRQTQMGGVYGFRMGLMLGPAFEGVANCLGPRWNSLWYFFSPVVPLFFCTIFSSFFFENLIWKMCLAGRLKVVGPQQINHDINYPICERGLDCLACEWVMTHCGTWIEFQLLDLLPAR